MKRRSDELFQKKSLSQIFLRDDWPCKKMVGLLKDAGIRNVLEIGPGGGILTRNLLQEEMHVLAYEKDPRFAEKLLETTQVETVKFPGKNLSVVCDDILSFDLKKWANNDNEHKAVCGNIPYNISSPILFWLLPHLKNIKFATLMVQLEFAERLASAPSSKDYGSLSVFTQLRSRVKFEYKVEKTCFFPIPKVDSAVISIHPLKELEDDETLKRVEKITRHVFTQRRKKLSNSLAPFLRDKDLSNFHIDFNRRCDTLSPREFVELTRALYG